MNMLTNEQHEQARKILLERYAANARYYHAALTPFDAALAPKEPQP